MRVIRESLKLILKPIVRVSLKFGISEDSFSEIARDAFIEVVYDDFRIEDKSVSVARCAVLTGLSRKAIIQRRKSIDNTVHTDSTNLALRAVQGWLTDPVFLTSKKKPRVLQRLGDGLSFPSLVAAHCGDVTQGAVREELLRMDVIELVGDAKVRLLISETPRPSAKTIADFESTAKTLSSEISNAMQNY